MAMNAALPIGSLKTNISSNNPIKSPKKGILPTVLLSSFLVDLTRGIPPILSNNSLNPLTPLPKKFCG